MQQHRAITGEGRYVDDVSVPGQVHLAVVRSDVAHGRIVGIDVSQALALPGVIRAIVPEDLAGVPRIPTRHPSPPEVQAWFQPVLPDAGVVRYVGQPVAAIVAEDAALAEDAAELVEVQIEPLDAVTPLEDSWPEAADLLFELDGGDAAATDEVFASAAHVFREELRVGRRSGMPIETRGLLAEWRDGVLRTWGPTKMVWFTRKVVAAALELPEDRVQCHRIDVGGMFGTRGEVYPEDILVPWAAKAVGRPVKWVEDRREHLLAINHTPSELHRYELAVGADGELLAFRDRVTFEMGAYTRPIGVRMAHMVTENLPGPYRWQAFDVHIEQRLSHRTPTGTSRAPTRIGSNFARERMIDLAARELGLDPLEIRRRNLITEGELPYERVVSDHETLLYEGGDWPAMFDDLVARAGGDDLLASIAERREAGECVGLGVSAYLEGSAPGAVSEYATASVDRMGRFRVVNAGSEVGQGLDETLRLVAAKRLGVEPGFVDVDTGSTFAAELGLGTWGSRSTIAAGSAVDAACQALYDRARDSAAELLGVEPEEIEVSGQGARHGGDLLRWSELGPLSAETSWRSDGVTFGFGLHLVVASVDPGTGVPVLEKVYAGFDAGKVIHEPGARGQMVGGTIQGIGAALFEELVFGPEGQPETTSFMEYRLPTVADLPRVEAVLWESGDSTNPIGVKGTGESGTAGIGAAVANAIAAALDGAPVLSLPVSREELAQLDASASRALATARRIGS